MTILVLLQAMMVTMLSLAMVLFFQSQTTMSGENRESLTQRSQTNRVSTQDQRTTGRRHSSTSRARSSRRRRGRTENDAEEDHSTTRSRSPLIRISVRAHVERSTSRQGSLSQPGEDSSDARRSARVGQRPDSSVVNPDAPRPPAVTVGNTTDDVSQQRMRTRAQRSLPVNPAPVLSASTSRPAEASADSSTASRVTPRTRASTTVTTTTSTATGATAENPILVHSGDGEPRVQPDLDYFFVEEQDWWYVDVEETDAEPDSTEDRDYDPDVDSSSSDEGVPLYTCRNDHLVRPVQNVTNSPCTICLERFKESDRAGQLPCQHVFHVTCISRWLKTRRTCPLCRLDPVHLARSRAAPGP